MITGRIRKCIGVCAGISLLVFGQVKIYAWEPNAGDLDTAIKTGAFGGYFTNITTWLNQKMPAAPAGVSEESMKSLLKDPVLVNTLDQRQFISKLGVDAIGAFAKADPANPEFLAWILKSTQIMDMFLGAVGPTSIPDRDRNNYSVSSAALARWQKILKADPEAKDGIYLKLAMATAIAPPGSGAPGAGHAKKQEDPLDRYKHFKSAHKNHELFPSFDNLNVWEYTKVVQSGASDSDLAWAREMINTWRPDLRINEQVVGSTSEVWRRNAPFGFTNGMSSVLDGGGKCGPRSSWAVFICQAFGIPAIGVGQPAHACVAAKCAFPETEPQPGSAWKVYQGRGWAVSRLDGTSGPVFLEAVNERAHAAEYSQIEHLRWLASSLTSKELAAAVIGVAGKLRPAASVVQAAPATAAKAVEKPACKPEAPFNVVPGVMHIEAEAFAKMNNVMVNDCFTGGKQVNILKSAPAWIDYTVDVPAAGTYAAQFMAAAVNYDQVIDVCIGTNKLATVKLVNTTGLWGKTEPVDIKLEKGSQTLRLAIPAQRGIAIRWFELKSK